MGIVDNLSNELIADPDVDQDFCSCCTEDEEWQDTEESLAEGIKDDLDEFSLRLFFKGASVSEVNGEECKVSGIGVVMERISGVPVIKVQKRLDFYADEMVVEHLALLDGLLAAIQSGARRIYAFTDSEKVYYQIAEAELLDDKLSVALGYRILELAEELEDFDIKLVSHYEIESSLLLANEAMGITSIDKCPICSEVKPSSKMIEMKCSHKFCSDCMVMHVENKLKNLRIPIRCPQPRCRYHISTSEGKSFLPATIYVGFERASTEVNSYSADEMYCPFPDCSVLLDPQPLSFRAGSSSQTDFNCIECPQCHRDICISCEVAWHYSTTCQEYQNLPLEERDAGDIAFHQLAQTNRWRRCLHCRQMIEHTEGCHHMTCRCGHEFCYSCGAGYLDGIQTCQCAFWDEDNLEPSIGSSSQESDMWNWDSFDSLPAAVDGYSEQERGQLALIQRFLAGGFSLTDHQPVQSPPRCSDSYMDTMKDLHQLPWLERFVSVISDSYSEGFIQ